VYRSSGAGGQHVNKTESAVRITHVPSGIVVACQTERSQHANRDRAMKMLKAKLYEMEIQKRNVEKAALEATKSDIGWGSQIRNYVLDQSRIKDLRTGIERRHAEGARWRPRRVHRGEPEVGPRSRREARGCVVAANRFAFTLGAGASRRSRRIQWRCFDFARCASYAQHERHCAAHTWIDR